jgi:hypothetical protein
MSPSMIQKYFLLALLGTPDDTFDRIHRAAIWSEAKGVLAKIGSKTILKASSTIRLVYHIYESASA